MPLTWLFQSTPSSRKVTSESGVFRRKTAISIHTFLAEGDRNHTERSRKTMAFQSTPSSRKVTKMLRQGEWRDVFQSTPSSRKVTEAVAYRIKSSRISIHTFLAEGDAVQFFKDLGGYISIHTFLAEGDSSWLILPKLTGISIHTFLAEGDGSWMVYEG